MLKNYAGCSQFSTEMFLSPFPPMILIFKILTYWGINHEIQACGTFDNNSLNIRQRVCLIAQLLQLWHNCQSHKYKSQHLDFNCRNRCCKPMAYDPLWQLSTRWALIAVHPFNIAHASILCTCLAVKHLQFPGQDAIPKLGATLHNSSVRTQRGEVKKELTRVGASIIQGVNRRFV